MYFSLEKLVNFQGNRYELAKACMAYAKKVRYLQSDEYREAGEKDALIAIKAVLDGNIKFTLDETEVDDDDFDDFDERPTDDSIASPGISED